MFQEILAENGTKFVVAAVVVLLGLLCLALVLWIVRGRPSSPFIRGGRNRTPRLAVLDAAAIDTRRRLVLVRRDDVEHLVMIGGPTDIVIETRIVAAAAEKPQDSDKPAQKTDRAEPAPAIASAQGEETAVAARATASAAAVPAGGAAERRPAAIPDGVSAMGKVLYAGEDAAPVRATPMRAATQPTATVQQAQAATQHRTPERRAEDMLEQSRQRVLATQPAATSAPAQVTSGLAAPRAVAKPPLENPDASAADNPALVSEFEKILEAEIASNAVSGGPARAATPLSLAPVRTGTLPGQGQAQPVAKSREETEAEMARLLGEIAANRKA